MTLNVDGHVLDAVLTRAENKSGKEDLFIIIHGFTGNKEEPHLLAIDNVAREFGFATLRVDMYGHGESEGEFENHTLFKWVTDLVEIIDYASELDFVRDIFLCGHSQGALVSMLAGAIKRNKVKALLPFSPAWIIPEQTRNGQILEYSFDVDDIPEKLDLWDDYTLGNNYIRVAQMIYVEPAIEKYKGPVFIIHGEEDATIPVEKSRELVKMYHDCTLVTIPGDTHCFDFHMDQMAAALKEWLKNRI